MHTVFTRAEKMPMRWRTLLACCLVALAGTGLARAQDDPVRSDQQILEQLERDWDTAFLHRDVRFIENVLADEFVAVYDDGTRGDKERELANAATFNRQIDSSSLDDFAVRVYGDTAVVTFSRHLVGPMQGRSVALNFRFVDVFVLRDGRWQCVLSQSTRVSGTA